MEARDLLISPMVYLEFDYLFQRKRIAFQAREMLAVLNTSFGVTICGLPFATVADAALNVTWTNDPFDRLIVAAAIAGRQAGLLTRDRKIHENYAGAMW
jgi:PIN domain nuclease of toxin-antitoxin system